jgi:3-oxoacyl-[acyl-carrier protein] reductase
MDLGIEGKVALVMGASRGIGRGIAGALAGEGARVAIASRSRERIEAAAREIAEQHETEVRGFVADTADVDSLPGLVASVEQALGPVEILITNTGGPPAGDPLAFERDQWEGAYRSLVLAPLALIEAVMPGMRERGWGRIVNVTSSATREPVAGLVLSNSHRLAAVGAFKTLANELARDGILLNSVAPGRIAAMPTLSASEVTATNRCAIFDPFPRIGRMAPLDSSDIPQQPSLYECHRALLVRSARPRPTHRIRVQISEHRQRVPTHALSQRTHSIFIIHFGQHDFRGLTTKLSRNINATN